MVGLSLGLGLGLRLGSVGLGPRARIGIGLGFLYKFFKNSSQMDIQVRKKIFAGGSKPACSVPLNVKMYRVLK
jgi:hypothetical protein